MTHSRTCSTDVENSNTIKTNAPTPQETSTFGTRAVKGGLATISGQLASFLLRTASAVVLARLLTPEDFGLLTMILAATAFLTPFRDFGLSTATVQQPRVNHGQLTSLFWINTAVGVALAAAFAALAPLLARFYHQPVLFPMALLLSVKFLFEGISVQHQAILRRQMRFGPLALVDVAALATASGVAILCSLAGLRYWALVVQQLTLPAVVALGTWLVCPWRPALPSKTHDVGQMVGFGSRLTGSQVLYNFSSGFDGLLVGWKFGAQAAGLYTKAFTVLLLPIQQIVIPLYSVAVASLSRLQGDPERYRRFYCQAVMLLAFVTTPIFVVLAVLSRDIILVVLGSQWLGATSVFTVLAIGQLGQPVAATVGWVNQSLGQADRILRWTLISVPLLMVSLLLALRWGPIGIAIAYAIGVHAMRPLYLWYSLRRSPISPRDWLLAVWRPFAVSGWMCVVMILLRDSMANWAPIARLIMCSLSGVAALAAATLVWPAARRDAQSLIVYVLAALRRPAGQVEALQVI